MTKTTLKKLKKEECLRDEIHSATSYLRDVKNYEHNLSDYGIKITLLNTLGTFATNNALYFYDRQLKKDLLNTIKIFLVKKIQDAEKKLKGRQKLEHIAEIEKENAELKKRNKAVETTLELNSKFMKSKLTEAKEIIKDYLIIVKGGHITVCSVPEKNCCINVLKLNEQAKQFLRDVER
jgi:hypothetical protein